MKTNKFWKMLMMSAAMLISGAMISCEKEEETPENFDAQISADISSMKVMAGDIIEFTVTSNTDWTATVADNSNILTLSKTEGSKGESAVTATISATAAEKQFATVTFTAMGYILGFENPAKAEITFTVSSDPSAKPVLIEHLEDLTAGTYYMCGFSEQYTPDSGSPTIYKPYSYHAWTGSINETNGNGDLVTINYEYKESEKTLAINPSASGKAAEIELIAVDGKENTYYIKSGSQYLYSKSGSNRQLALGTTPEEWVFSDFTKGGMLASNNGANLVTADATYNLIRSYGSTSSRSYGIVFFTASEVTLTEGTPAPAPGDPEHAGTVEDPYTVADAIAKAYATGTTTTAEGYYIKGIVASIAEPFSAQYGNATFDLTDEAGSTDVFKAFRIYYLGNRKWVDGDTAIKEGDEVIVYGKIVNYMGNTPETATGTGYLYSLNGETGGDAPEQPGENESADVTLPYTLDTTGSLQGSSNAYAGTANATVAGVTWAFEGNSQINPWRLGGKSITNTDRAVYTKTAMNADVKAIELTHGTANDITVNSLTLIVSKNNDFSSPVSTLPIEFAASKTTTIEKPAGADWNGCYYKFVYNVTVAADQNKFVQFCKVVFTDGNGGGGNTDPEPDPETPSDAKAVTVAEFNAAEESQTQVYELTGVVSGSINTTYGNFDLVDETGSVYVYGLSTGEQVWGSKTDQTFSSMGIGAGDKIKIRGYRGSYNDKIEVMHGWLVEIVEKGSTDEPGTGGETPADGDFASDTQFVCSKDDSSTSSYTLGKSTFNGEAATGFKLGTASKVGKFTSEAVGVTGDYTLSLYGVAWKGQKGTLKVSVVGGGSVEGEDTCDLASNDGASNNAPYTITVSGSDYYEFSLKGLTATSTIVFETVTGAYRAIVAGVHLSK